MLWTICRLKVVSTRVGGIPEVFPPDMITLATPSVPGKVYTSHNWFYLLSLDLVTALEEIILHHRRGEGMSPQDMHNRVKEMYKWQDVAERTEKVYNVVSQEKTRSFVQRIHRYTHFTEMTPHSVMENAILQIPPERPISRKALCLCIGFDVSLLPPPLLSPTRKGKCAVYFYPVPKGEWDSIM